jgi:hypothetical protein
VYVYFKDYSKVKDRGNMTLAATSESHMGQITGYILSKQTKTHNIKLTAITARGYLWMSLVVVLISLLLLRVKSGFLLWNLFDFLQRLAALSFISAEIPFNIKMVFHSLEGYLFKFVPLDIFQEGGYFLRECWVILLLIIIGELIIMALTYLCELTNAEQNIRLIWRIRFRVYSVIALPLFLNIFDTLKEETVRNDYMSGVLAVASAMVYLSYFVMIWRNLYDNFELQPTLAPEKTMEALSKYREFIEEIDPKQQINRSYELINIAAKIAIALVIFLFAFAPRLQLAMLVGIELGLAYITKKHNTFIDSNVFIQNMLLRGGLITTEMILLWTCDGLNVSSNFNYCWFAEVILAIILLGCTAIHVNRFLMRTSVVGDVNAVDHYLLQSQNALDRKEFEPMGKKSPTTGQVPTDKPRKRSELKSKTEEDEFGGV